MAEVEEEGEFAAQLADIEEVSAYHGDNYEVLVHRFYRMDRATMLDLAGKLGLVATSSDASVLTALEHASAWHYGAARPHPAAPAAGGQDLTRAWRRVGELAARGHRPPPPGHGGAAALRGDGVHLPGRGAPHRGHRGHRGRGVRRLAREPDAVEGVRAAAGGVLRRGRLARHGGRVHARLRHAHLDAAGALDAGYEDNADLVIGEDGTPSVKRRRSAGTPKAAERLAEAVERRMPERSLLSIVARPRTGSAGNTTSARPAVRPEDRRPPRAVLHGSVHRRGQHRPVEAARHIAGVSARELSMVRNRHIDLKKLNSAIATVVNAFNELDVVKAWGDGNDGRRRRHPGRDLHRQPPGRDLDQVRRGRRYRVPLHFRHVRCALLQIHSVWGLGGGAPDRGAAGQRVRHPAVHGAC